MSDEFEQKFDELVELFKKNPEAFYKKCDQIIESKLIEMCGDDPLRLERYKKMHWRIQQELFKFKDPIARHNKLVEIFWKQVDQFHKSLNDLSHNHTKENKKSATIIHFKK